MQLGYPETNPRRVKPESRVKSAVQVKWMDTNARSMGSKQEELEAMHHEIVEFPIFGETRGSIKKTSTLDSHRAEFGLFKRIIWKVPWKAALKNKGFQEEWACFKTILHFVKGNKLL